jgi:DNA-binding NarL/FixJ family response regulator
MSRTRLLLADDHALVAQALASFLDKHYELSGVVTDGNELIAAAKRLSPDVIVADLEMPGVSGIEALRQLRAAGSAARFIVITMHTDAALADEALRAGASGYLLKHSAADELLVAISAALRGDVYITPRISRDLMTMLHTSGKSGAAHRLTARQREVLRLIATGQTMKEVAAQLDLSPRTVEMHKYEIMHSLGVRTTAELVNYAVRNGLATLI